jgi:hypothetical protein
MHSQILKRSVVARPAPTLALFDNVNHAPSEHAQPLEKVDVRRQRAATIKRSDNISHFTFPAESPSYRPPTLSARHFTEEPIHSEPPKDSLDLLFENALKRATNNGVYSKKQVLSKLHIAGLLAIPALLIAMFVLAGPSFTKIQLKAASSQAGFATALPTMHPVGFSLNKFQTNDGIFSGDYTSKTGAEAFTITERATLWNAQALLSDYVVHNTLNYSQIQIGTKTVYLYGDGDATWVANGVWYEITSDGALNQSQLIDMANNL